MRKIKWLQCILAMVVGFAGGIVLTEVLVAVAGDSDTLRGLRFLPVYTALAGAAVVLIWNARRK